MAFLPAVRAAVSTYRAVKSAPAHLPASEAAYWQDWFRNGWAAVAGAFGAFWSTLREWGGTDFAALAAAVAANPVAGRAMRLVVDAAAAVPVVAMRETGDADKEAPDHPALLALRRGGWSDTLAAYLWGLYCGGEAFLVRLAPTTGPNAGQARVVRALRNDRLARIDRDALGDPVSYTFNRLYAGETGGPGGSDTYPAADVLHVRLYNPADVDKGLPIVLSARRPLTIVEEADAWNRGIARGGGRVPGYFMPKMQDGGTLSGEQVATAQAQADRATMERQRLNLPQVMSGHFDYQAASVSPREADWLKGRQVAMREIAAVMGVPATLLADEKGGSLTDAGVDSEVAALYKLTVIPILSRLYEALSLWLMEDGARLVPDYDQVAALQEDMDAKYLRYAGAVVAKLVTTKEARVALGHGAEPAPDMIDEPAAAPPVPEPEDPPAIRALKGLSDDGLDALLKLIPQAAA